MTSNNDKTKTVKHTIKKHHQTHQSDISYQNTPASCAKCFGEFLVLLDGMVLKCLSLRCWA